LKARILAQELLIYISCRINKLIEPTKFKALLRVKCHNIELFALVVQHLEINDGAMDIEDRIINNVKSYGL
jgi:hypothetical protein